MLFVFYFIILFTAFSHLFQIPFLDGFPQPETQLVFCFNLLYSLKLSTLDFQSLPPRFILFPVSYLLFSFSLFFCSDESFSEQKVVITNIFLSILKPPAFLVHLLVLHIERSTTWKLFINLEEEKNFLCISVS